MNPADNGRSTRAPRLSVVVVVHNMPREAPRTLRSLSATYQRHIDPSDYEVIVVDNGSTPAFDLDAVPSLSGNFRLIRLNPAPASPARAVNCGLAEAGGEVVGVMIDGARLVTPGLLHFARHAAMLYDRAIVAALGWYLGFDVQPASVASGYDAAREDALLASIDWPEDGYRLFDIGTMDESSVDGWLQPISESNALFLRREFWDALGGVDEQFDAPGGGLLNLDTFRRAVETPGAELVVLLGEASFHQVHGGISTNASLERQHARFFEWANQYEKIRGRRYEVARPAHDPTFVGTLPRGALRRLTQAALHPHRRHHVAPLGGDFDTAHWTTSHRPAADPGIAALIELSRQELRGGRLESATAVARLIRERDPNEPAAHALLSFSAPWPAAPSAEDKAQHHYALGEAHRLLGERDAAAGYYRAALAEYPDFMEAHVGWADVRMPGADYLVWLDRMYQWRAAEVVLDIGVGRGDSIALVRPPAIAIGVDPQPYMFRPLRAETHIYIETSDEFFARKRLAPFLGTRTLPAAFIDGLHLYEQALRDFVNVEAWCGPQSIVFIHDTVPLNELTQRRAQETRFHTGDVWKTVLCLKRWRPDLDIFTIATQPTGLTVVTGLDPASRVLRDRFDDVVAELREMAFADVEPIMETALNIVPADWAVVEARLRDRLSAARHA